MNKRNRLLSLLSDKNSSERVASFWHHFPKDRWFSDAAVEAHLKYYYESDIDFVKIMEEVRYEFDITIASDWNRYIPDRRKTKDREAQLDVIKRITDRIGSECMVFTTIFDPLRSVGITKGYDFIDQHIKENEKAVAKAMCAMAESIAEYALDCLEAGADGIYFSSKGAEIGRFNEGVFHSIVQAPDRYITDEISRVNDNTILHICGYDTELTYYKDFNASIINWDCHHGRYDLNLGSEVFPDKVILGGINNREGVLMDGTQNEIEIEVQRVLSEYTSKNRLILGADCTLDENIDYMRVKQMVQAYHEYR